MRSELRRTAMRALGLVVTLTVIAFWTGTAVATHRFGDVPDTHTHAAGIGWVADAGITTGCGDGSDYCPDDPVTRAQMGAFMHRLSGNAPGVAPSVNAALLDGHTAEELLAGGEQGPEGPAGPAGPAGPPGIADVQIVEGHHTVANAAVNTATAMCPAGKVVLGGGGHSDPGWALLASYPFDEFDGTGWAVHYQKFEGTGPHTATAYATCATVAS
jgi:hypothetical protein